jgi:glycosyltransferase involved in cell wall biosynthesis
VKVVFILPNAGRVPIGGFKVVYEYANHLARRGHQITLVHAAQQRMDTPFPELMRRIAHYWRVRVNRGFGPAGWFALDPSVSVRWVLRPDAASVPDADAIVATAWDIAEWVHQYPEPKGKKFYLIQHLETWDGPEERVLATWRMPLRKIVIARWLAAIAEKFGEEATYIPNGLDFAAFGLDCEPSARDPQRLGMLFHRHPWKGSADGLQAFAMIRQRFPQATLEMFGVPDPPTNLPDGVIYRQRPSPQELRALYNRCAIFLAPSRTEGWGLTATEAMACGAALAATDIGGHREFAIPNQTALCSPPEKPEELAANGIRLIEDAGMRASLAFAGRSFVEQFTWQRAADAFEACLLSGTIP